MFTVIVTYEKPYVKNKYNYDKYYEYTIIPATKEKSQIGAINAKSYCAVDYRDNHILVSGNEHQRLPMASTTKILTAVLTLESGKLNDKTEISTNAASQPKVRLGMKKGSIFCIKDLLYSLMLCSHNDSAVAIAEHIGGSAEGFASLMNNKAQAIGAYDSSFVTPNGLDNEKHFSTAYDLCVIGSYAMHNKDFVNIINTKSYSFSDNNCNNYSLNNINKFLSMSSDNIGIKTGFTGKAGNCFVGAYCYDDTIVVSCVLGSGYPPNNMIKYNETNKIKKYIKKNFSNTIVNVPDMIIMMRDAQNNAVRINIENECFDILSDSSENVSLVCCIDNTGDVNCYIQYGNVKRMARYKQKRLP